jgi:phenylalanyl-tRNA synthetase beta chain
MKVSLNWLCDYTDLQGIPVADISHALTMVGFEVEGIHETGLPPLDKVVVGEILEFAQHPNADRLSVCRVQVDAGEPRTIVCGAKNFRTGDRVIVALPGAVLPGNFEIKESALRGVTSGGMMCSERELGLGDDHAGIAILTHRPAIGTPVNAVYADRDVVFDIEVTPNRPDALSHLGIARELAAWFRKPLRYPEVIASPNTAAGGSLIDGLECQYEEGCPHYRGYSVRGLAVGDSPAWLKQRLQAIGLRPINNVVDITNYVLHECGQPLHAFDAAKIGGKRIIVRPARPHEKMRTLDDKERSLDPSMLVIADAHKALVVAGVMGSIDAEVDASTCDIFLEAAWFRPGMVRRTARTLGLSTDSSYRFERSVDPGGTEYAALRCLDLILELCGGTLLGPPRVFGEAPITEREIALSPQYVRDRLGFDVDDAVIADQLTALELDVRPTTDDADQPLLRVGIPSFRQDLYRPIDLVEEFLRIYGCDKIPAGDTRCHGTLHEDDPVVRYVRAASEHLAAAGFSEAMHYSLRSEGELRRWYGNVEAALLALANPLASDASHLRPSLIPGLLDCIALNQSRHNPPARLFESGRVFREHNGRVYEWVALAFVWVESEPPVWAPRAGDDYYRAARLGSDLLALAGIQLAPSRIQPLTNENGWQDGHAGVAGDFKAGYILKCGLINPATTDAWSVSGKVFGGTLYLLPELLKRGRKRRSYRPFSAFPPAVRDLAFVVPADLPAGQVRDTIERLGAKNSNGFTLESVTLFDVYTGPGLPPGTKSVACALLYRSPDRTLQDKEVNDALSTLHQLITTRTGWSVRS